MYFLGLGDAGRLEPARLPIENWRSTIRGEPAVSAHYANLVNWVGRETADIVYLDAAGALTRYLRHNMTTGSGRCAGPHVSQCNGKTILHACLQCQIQYICRLSLG
jgi:hypothetical protein